MIKTTVTTQELIAEIEKNPEGLDMKHWPTCIAGYTLRAAGYSMNQTWEYYHPETGNYVFPSGNLPSQLLNVGECDDLWFMSQWPWNNDESCYNLPQVEIVAQAIRAIKYYMLGEES